MFIQYGKNVIELLRESQNKEIIVKKYINSNYGLTLLE